MGKIFFYYIINIYEPSSILGYGEEWFIFTSDENNHAAFQSFKSAENVLRFINERMQIVPGTFLPGIIAKEIK